ncbi:hypothetical protein P153DRAFT_395065 [Dothidotthia symphoricarpi CBS 119687]|uniref:F-box domain-containing protein n=1 Tax=Dothidotthia symphoricarpi CBS 119687 TaxID=1392245 RepID=A0A6A6ALJ8_9PLEO|nr:uncharacterized protein P153DRAFT_395065 [Dothidotthia symphoricarpi CBS 119687]KAF2131757.1 hypothetical protein P153DRAFT_395065 [Dothidotthia symphoricarpi CBS 119687]
MIMEAYSETRVDLVEDVKRTVLDYISLPSDLKALCLTSRSWRDVTTKCLYTNIVLDIRFRDGQLSTFDRCLKHGALEYLQHARTLTLLDTSKHNPCSTVRGDDVVPEGSVWSSRNEMDELLLHILHQFPRHILRTFGYISKVKISTACLDLINERQQSIQNMHVTKCDPRQLIAPSRHCITAGFHDDELKTRGYLQLAQALPPLDFLHLIFWSGWSSAVWEYWDDPHPHSLIGDRKILARQLTLTGYMPPSFTSKIGLHFDWSIVTSLTLLQSYVWPPDQLAQITELQHLTHFHLNTSAALQLDSAESLYQLFERNKSLQSVHLGLSQLATLSLSWFPEKKDRIPGRVLHKAYLWPLRHSLKSLSLHDPMLYRDYRDMHSSPGIFSYGRFKSICGNFPHLQQLALQVPSTYAKLSEHGVPRTYVKCIRQLKDLRILHFHQQRLAIVPQSNTSGKYTMASKIHAFANSLFQWSHTKCPSLRVFIWGMTGKPDEAHEEMVRDTLREGQTLERVPQFLFVKRQRKLDCGNTQVYAATVTPSQLREEVPELDLLSYDAGDPELDLIAQRTGW